MNFSGSSSRFSKERIYALLGTFFTAFFSNLLFPLFFPKLHLLFFVPFLIFVYYRYSFLTTLWIVSCTGLVNDLFASHFFGISSINYLLTTLLIYRWKNHFFVDKLSTLPVMTALFSSLSSILHWLLLFFLDQSFPLSPTFVFTDFFLMPIADALFAFAFFTLPLMIKKRRGAS